MAKKYEIPMEEPRLVSEPAAAYALQRDYEHKMNIYMLMGMMQNGIIRLSPIQDFLYLQMSSDVWDVNA